MKLETFYYECTCGWIDKIQTGGFRSNTDAYSDAKRISEKKIHPRTRHMWSKLLEHPLLIAERDRSKPDELEIPYFLRKRGSNEKPPEYLSPHIFSQNYFGTCPYCKTLDQYLVLISENDKEQLNRSLCYKCGEEVILYKDRNINCPQCGKELQEKRCERVLPIVQREKLVRLAESFLKSNNKKEFLPILESLINRLSGIPDTPLYEVIYKNEKEWVGAILNVFFKNCKIFDHQEQFDLTERITEFFHIPLEELLSRSEKVQQMLNEVDIDWIKNGSETLVIAIGGTGIEILRGKSLYNCYTVALDVDENDLSISTADKKFNTSNYERKIGISILGGARKIILVAGLGKKTGSSITPLLAEIASELQIETSIFVTMPVHFEGIRRIQLAKESANKLVKSHSSVNLLSPGQVNDKVALESIYKRQKEAIWERVLKEIG